MAFMKPQYEKGTWYEVETTSGHEVIPADLVSKDPVPEEFADFLEGGYISHTSREGVGAQLSASGYTDSTFWAVFDTMEEARKHVENVFGVDPDTGEEKETWEHLNDVGEDEEDVDYY